MNDKLHTATFAAGCFWGIQDSFDQLDGVVETTVGYTGGKTEDPNYEQVCSDTTGHAEAVQVKFDPEVISYEELLNNFWKMHNPTQMHRQGSDVGSQYRSTIFYHDDTQKDKAEKSKQDHQSEFDNNIVTEITKATKFYPAEEYHQKYFKKTGKKVCH
ncbi:peptide-methionine (S)-S-oxide reductase MsrA [Patescibacteria group bacterium]|nr:peptide-methionine (S)-S-oxide reductase MsrA [Patescibacteria group bacterium]